MQAERVTVNSGTAFWAEWRRAAPHIQAALARDGMHSLADVLAEVLSGQAIFVPGEKSALVYQIIAYPKGRAIRFWLAGGDLDELQEMEKMLTEQAKALGCDHAEIMGRRGWARALNGYEEAATVLRRKL